MAPLLGPYRIIPARAGPTMFGRDSLDYSSDHPRSCGANLGSNFRWLRLFGSSPLVRGQLFCFRHAVCCVWIIPARAGPTGGVPHVACRHADHPRSCGANRACRSLTQCRSGSSPLVRGQLQERISKLAHMRIIPARAGPTKRLCYAAFVLSDHPRSCGANLRKGTPPNVMTGSSPLVRGQPCLKAKRTRVVRIIPARAGPTDNHRTSSRDTTDHPRSCGANILTT